MAFLWIFALAIVAVATAEEAPGAAPGCGEPEPTTPKPREHGIVTNANLCNSTILVWNGQELPASCEVHCPQNRTQRVSDLKLCLKFSSQRFLQERKDETPYTCKLGLCLRGKCRTKQFSRKVPCKVPADRLDLSK
uniref:Evasin n=1 Tax=Amblyomma cajennense TaxID=34607 RepID=A0A023FSZ5_AMBCJ